MSSVASHFGTLFVLIEMVVPAAILNNGEAIDKLDSAMFEQAGLLRAPTADATRKASRLWTRWYTVALPLAPG